MWKENPATASRAGRVLGEEWRPLKAGAALILRQPNAPGKCQAARGLYGIVSRLPEEKVRPPARTQTERIFETFWLRLDQRHIDSCRALDVS
jgi:hypothetical protein